MENIIHTSKTLVSIGIPFYNAEEYLELAIRSVLNQSYDYWELLLLDDGSTDNSLMIALSFHDQRIKVISDGENKGLVFRLNQLTLLARGVFYARMDADDIMHIDRIKIQFDYLNNHPRVDIVGSSYYSIDSNNQIVGRLPANPFPNSLKNILKNGCFAHPTIMGKTDWFRKNPYNSKMIRMEDFELWLRTINYSHFENLSEPLFFYRNVGIPTLKKYIKSNFGIIKMLFKMNEYRVSIIDSITYSTFYFLKIIFYCVYAIFGKMDLLIKKRSKLISVEETIIAQESLLRSIRV